VKRKGYRTTACGAGHELQPFREQYSHIIHGSGRRASFTEC
jgi:hypothetical protein